MATAFRKPKLIISDVDGTLFDTSEQFTEQFYRLRDLITAKDIPFTLASGRSPDMLRHIVETLAIRLPVIANNGATAFSVEGTIWDEYLDPMLLKAAIQKADSMDMVVIMGNGKSETAYRHNAYIQNQIETFGRYNHFYIPLEREWPTLNIQKVHITDPQRPGRIDDIVELLAPYAERIDVVRYNGRSIDVMPKGASKGAAIIKLAAVMGIPIEDVLAVGDARNDAEMLFAAGVGVAVGNADDELKVQADYVCKRNNVDGVVEAIERYWL